MLSMIAILSPAAAQAADEPTPEQSEGEEIVVTGERVDRTLRQTPSSVAVVGQRDIEASGANRVEQMLALIPNVQLGNGSQGPAIRGMDTTGPLYALPAFLGGNRPRMTIVVDGRATTYNEFVFGSFPVWDVDRIEVFRSPQTTTQGQNSIAGAIFVESNDPSSRSEFNARGIVGNYGTWQASALVSTPIAGERGGFRLAADLRYAKTTGWIADVMRGGDPNHDVMGVLRGKLVVAPADGTRVELTYLHSQTQAPQVVGVKAPFHRRRDPGPNYGIFRINVDSLTAQVRQRLGEDLEAKLVLSGGDSDARRLAIPNFGETHNQGRDWQLEGVLNWSPQGPLQVVGGVSRNHVALKQSIDLSLLSGAMGRFRDWQDGTGLFAEASYALSPRATVTAGVRYQRDRQERKGALTANGFAVPIDYVGEFDAWLPKLTFAYDIKPDLRIGAMVQKAYNPGGTTVRVDKLTADEFKAEHLWDFELFARARFADGKGVLNANLFYYDMRDAQRAQDILVFTPTGRPAGFANLFTVPKARTHGAEADLSWRWSDRLSTRLAAGLLATKIVGTDADSAHLEGNQFDRSPRFSGAVSIDWRPTDRLRLTAQARHHSSYFSDPENTPALRINSATSVDARAEIRAGRFAVFGQVRNLFDAFNMLDLASPTSGEAEDPRTLSIGLETRF